MRSAHHFEKGIHHVQTDREESNGDSPRRRSNCFVGLGGAAAAPVTTPFQIQTFKLADLPTPQISATVGVESGAATFMAANPTNSNAVASPISVRWFSLGTGASGFATFAAGGQPAPIDIKPGVGQVVALIVGGLYPGFGTFYVP